jgi:hypothetical protein
MEVLRIILERKLFPLVMGYLFKKETIPWGNLRLHLVLGNPTLILLNVLSNAFTRSMNCGSYKVVLRMEYHRRDKIRPRKLAYLKHEPKKEC